MSYECFCGWKYCFSLEEKKYIGKEPIEIPFGNRILLACPKCGNLFWDKYNMFGGL